MTEPLVSVKMITYNHKPYIARAIEGVINQKTDFPFELVIGEDCSTDGTREIVFDYAKRYPEIIKVITSEQNVGMKENGRRTRLVCRGKYTAWCEGDDYWHRMDKLQIQVNHLEGHPECGMIHSDSDIHIMSTDTIIRNFLRSKNIQLNPTITDMITGHHDVITCTVMARKNLIDRIIAADPFLHQSGHFKMGDTQIWAEMSTLSRIDYLDESFAVHQVLSESASKSRDIKNRLRFSISGIEMIVYLCDKYRLSEEVRRFQSERLAKQSLRLSFFERKPDHAKRIKQCCRFSFTDWIFYWGTQNKLGYFIVRLLLHFKPWYSRFHSGVRI